MKTLFLWFSLALFAHASMSHDNLKNGEFHKEATQNCDSEQVTVAEEKEDIQKQNIETTPTQSNPLSSNGSGIEVVYHVATLNQWEEIVQEQLHTLEASNLAAAADRITITVVGPHFKKVEDLVQNTSFASKTELIHFSQNVRYCEFPGIEKVQEIAKEKPNSKVLYFHSKGVTYLDPDKSRNVRSWRRFMEYFVIQCWHECMESLTSSNMCGVEWLNTKHPNLQEVKTPGFFAGNFWWARADYLSTCAPMIGTPNGPEWCFKHRFDCEVFINTGKNPEPTTFHQSFVNLYEFNYSPEYYIKEQVLEKPIEIVYLIIATDLWLPTFYEQFHLLHSSHLLSSCTHLTAIVLGPLVQEIEKMIATSPFREKIKMIYANSQLHLGEFPAIEMLKSIANRQPKAKICYIHNHTPEPFMKPSRSIGEAITRTWIHTKKQLSKRYKNWTKRLLGKTVARDLTISCWEECIHALETADLCGSTWKKSFPKGSHFPDVICRGYFSDHSWWANAEYLQTCQYSHYRSPYSLYHTHWSKSWLRQFFADCQMFSGNSDHDPIVHEITKT